MNTDILNGLLQIKCCASVKLCMCRLHEYRYNEWASANEMLCLREIMHVYINLVGSCSPWEVYRAATW